MNTVTIGIYNIEALKQRTAAASRGEHQGERISFASVELLWQALTPRRWGLIRAMAGQGPMSLRAAARHGVSLALRSSYRSAVLQPTGTGGCGWR